MKKVTTYNKLKFDIVGDKEHLLHGHRKCKLQLLLEEKLDKKYFHKKLSNLLFISVSEVVISITGKAFQSLEILQKYELELTRLLDAIWISFLSLNLVKELLKVTYWNILKLHVYGRLVRLYKK